MSQEQQPQRPVTYGDILPVQGALATQPVTAEDAALMQSAKTFVLGHTRCGGGAAAAMQSAADESVKAGAVSKHAHDTYQGVTVIETILPGEFNVRTEFVGGQPISTSAAATPNMTPMVPAVATLLDTVTIGEALESVAILRAGDEPIEPSDASAIQSAEKRATGTSLTSPGGMAATAQAAAELNPRVEDFAKTTLSDVLMDASSKLPCDKAVTWDDAEKVVGAELRHKQTNELREGGVAAAFIAAAELNDKVASAPSSQIHQLKVEDTM